MTATDHPFSDERVAEAADDRGADEADLDAALTDVQEAISREDSDREYEYSSQHNFGWRDDDAYYLYGDGVWATLREELSLDAAVAEAARAVHRREMLAAAAERDERAAVEELFEDGTEPLVVVDTASDPPLFGQDV